jgi:hypothetical protein
VTITIVHFIGFRGEEYWSAVKVWGRPHFIHRRWDRRAQRDIGPGEVLIFATGDEDQPLAKWNSDDIDESFLLPVSYPAPGTAPRTGQGSSAAPASDNPQSAPPTDR